MKRIFWILILMMLSIPPVVRAEPPALPVTLDAATLHLICDWVAARQADARTYGRALTRSERRMARRIGVRHPELVRIVQVDSISFPDDPVLSGLAASKGLASSFNIAQTLEYAIFVRSGVDEARPLIAHELTHVRQYERLGGVKEFMCRYLGEISAFGYDDAPLEKEAEAVAARFHKNR